MLLPLSETVLSLFVFVTDLQYYFNCVVTHVTSVIHSFPSPSSPRAPGIDPSPAIFGVVKRITDQDIEAHSNQQVHMTCVIQ